MSTAAAGDQRDKQANDGEMRDSSLGWMTLLTTVAFVAASAVLFAAGRAYRQGYLYELGFDLSQMPSDFHETLFWGFSTGGPLFFAWLVAAVIALPLCGLVVWITGSTWQRSTKRWPNLRRVAIPDAQPGRPMPTHVKLVAGVFILIPVAYIFALAHIATGEFRKAGTKRGKQVVAALRANASAASKEYDLRWIEIHLGASDTNINGGYRLLCAETLCSIYDPDPKARTVRLVSLDNLREIRIVDKT